MVQPIGVGLIIQSEGIEREATLSLKLPESGVTTLSSIKAFREDIDRAVDAMVRHFGEGT